MSSNAKADLAKFFSTNRQWAEKVNATEPTFFKETAKTQTPKILWLGCADSRVPESVLMAVKPGEVFVHRNIAK
jgi:carbonic anhydrase